MLASRRIDVGSVLKNTLPPERVEGVSLCGVHAWGTHVHIRRVPPDLTLHDRCPPNCCPPKLISSHTRWDFRPQVHTNTTGVSGLRQTPALASACAGHLPQRRPSLFPPVPPGRVQSPPLVHHRPEEVVARRWRARWHPVVQLGKRGVGRHVVATFGSATVRYDALRQSQSAPLDRTADSRCPGF